MRPYFHLPVLVLMKCDLSVGVFLLLLRHTLRLRGDSVMKTVAEYICMFHLPQYQSDSVSSQDIGCLFFFFFWRFSVSSRSQKLGIASICLEKLKRLSGKGQSAVFILTCRCV